MPLARSRSPFRAASRGERSSRCYRHPFPTTQPSPQSARSRPGAPRARSQPLPPSPRSSGGGRFPLAAPFSQGGRAAPAALRSLRRGGLLPPPLSLRRGGRGGTPRWESGEAAPLPGVGSAGQGLSESVFTVIVCGGGSGAGARLNTLGAGGREQRELPLSRSAGARLPVKGRGPPPAALRAAAVLPGACTHTPGASAALPAPPSHRGSSR